jgi:hypothetical protein
LVHADGRTELDKKFRTERGAVTKARRRAIRYRKANAPRSPEGVRAVLKATRGLWTEGDGIAYQRRLRGDGPKR